jgi:Sulfatase
MVSAASSTPRPKNSSDVSVLLELITPDNAGALGAVRHLIPDRLILDFGVLFREMLGRTVSPFLISGGKPIPRSPPASVPLRTYLQPQNHNPHKEMKIRSGALRVLLKARWRCGTAFALPLAIIANVAYSQQKADQTKKPNIVVIMGDYIGMWNVGAYTHGMMGRTPNIDRIAKEGILFTDHYAQPSCTAGRAAFITGQLPVRTGMTTIGIPGSKRGIQNEDPTLAEVLKSVGYATAQFGKNHLGDRNEFLPTVHGFDEWFGNLYHLNAEEEPEQLDYPGQKNPAYTERFGPRGVLHTWATNVDDPTEDPKFGRVASRRSKAPVCDNLSAHKPKAVRVLQ